MQIFSWTNVHLNSEFFHIKTHYHMYSNVHWSLCFLDTSAHNLMEKPITLLQTLLYACSSSSMLKGTASVHRRVNSLCWFMTVCSALVMKTAEQQMFVGIIKPLLLTIHFSTKQKTMTNSEKKIWLHWSHLL